MLDHEPVDPLVNLQEERTYQTFKAAFTCTKDGYTITIRDKLYPRWYKEYKVIPDIHVVTAQTIEWGEENPVKFTKIDYGYTIKEKIDNDRWMYAAGSTYDLRERFKDLKINYREALGRLASEHSSTTREVVKAKAEEVLLVFIPIEQRRLTTDPQNLDYELLLRRQRLYNQLQVLFRSAGLDHEQTAAKIYEHLFNRLQIHGYPVIEADGMHCLVINEIKSGYDIFALTDDEMERSHYHHSTISAEEEERIRDLSSSKGYHIEVFGNGGVHECTENVCIQIEGDDEEANRTMVESPELMVARVNEILEALGLPPKDKKEAAPDV